MDVRLKLRARILSVHERVSANIGERGIRHDCVLGLTVSLCPCEPLLKESIHNTQIRILCGMMMNKIPMWVIIHHDISLIQ